MRHKTTVASRLSGKRLAFAWRWFVARTRPWLLLLLCGGVLMPPTAQATDTLAPVFQKTRTEAKAPEFVLQDQYNKTHHYRFPRETLSILLFADHSGAVQLEDWIRPIYARYHHTVGIYGVAELSIVPKLLHGLVRTLFRERLDYPVMLDWQGTVARRYAYQKGRAHLFIIDTRGHIVFTVVGAAEASKLHQVFTQIDRLLDGK